MKNENIILKSCNISHVKNIKQRKFKSNMKSRTKNYAASMDYESVSNFHTI